MKSAALSSIERFTRKVCAMVSLSACCLPIHAMSHTYECPAYVSSVSINAYDIKSPWIAYGHSVKLTVVSVGISDGMPLDMAFLKPYETEHDGDSTIVRWKLGGEYPKGIWLSCGYEGNVLSLAMELPGDIDECVVEYKNEKSIGIKINSITCR